MKIEVDAPKGYEFTGKYEKSFLYDGFQVVIMLEINPVNNEQHDPHTELKEQYALDVETCKSIYGLEAWQLWQVQRLPDEWITLSPEFKVFGIYLKYRRHQHADSIIEYHKCSDADKKRWQMRNTGTNWYFVRSFPDWNADEYRLKPRTITINGKEYNAQMNVAPEVGKSYWYFLEDFCPRGSVWAHDNVDLNRLKNNLCFLNKEDCQAVCDAFKEILIGAE